MVSHRTVVKKTAIKLGEGLLWLAGILAILGFMIFLMSISIWFMVGFFVLLFLGMTYVITYENEVLEERKAAKEREVFKVPENYTAIHWDTNTLSADDVIAEIKKREAHGQRKT